MMRRRQFIMHLSRAKWIKKASLLRGGRHFSKRSLPLVWQLLELGLFERPGIGFQRDLGVRFQAEKRAHGRQKTIERLWREETWSSAAEENGFHSPAIDFRHDALKVRDQCVDVSALGDRLAGFMRVEVTVGALPQAPRHMNVKRKRRQHTESDALTDSPQGGGCCIRPALRPRHLVTQPRPTNGILVAMIVRNCTFVSRGRQAM